MTSYPGSPGNGSSARVNASPLGLRASLTLLAALIVVTAVVFGTCFLALRFVPGARGQVIGILTATLLVVSTLYLATIHLALRRADTHWRALGFTRPTLRIFHLLWQIPVIVMLAAAAQVSVIAMTGTDADEPPTNAIDTLFINTGPLYLALLLVAVVILTPLWEEAIFRGVIGGGVRRRHGAVLAAVVSAVAFAVAHFIPILLAYYLVMGLSLAYLREFHRTLWAPTIMHAVVNAIASSTLVAAALTA